MYLLFDISVFNEISVTVFSDEQQQTIHVEAKNRDLLFVVSDLLKKEGVDPKEIIGIAVVIGAGSFTSTRIAVTVGNAWAYAKQIPIIGVSLEEAKDFDLLIQKLKKAKAGIYLSATYSGEPNIG